MTNKTQRFCLGVLLASGFALIIIALLAKTKVKFEGIFKVGIND